MTTKKIPAQKPKITSKPSVQKEGVPPAMKKDTLLKIAVIRLRGHTGIRHDIDMTLQFMNLNRTHTCALFPKNPSALGMIKKVKDYVTWGDIDEKTITILADKRGKKGNDEGKGHIYHLNPPRGGFERKGIKVSYSSGGALGYRKSAINTLIQRMI